MKKYHEETISLVKYYLMDIPQDVCAEINKFESNLSANLLGPDWHEFLFDKYEKFKGKRKSKNKGEEYIKAEFKEQTLKSFYEVMGYVFRGGFGTASLTDSKTVNELAGLLFGKY